MAETEWLRQLDELHEAKRFAKIHKELKKYIDAHRNCDDVEVLWRYARAVYDLSSGTASTTAPPSVPLSAPRQSQVFKESNKKLFYGRDSATSIGACR